MPAPFISKDSDITHSSPGSIWAQGLARTFQRSRLNLSLTVFDNVVLGAYRQVHSGLWHNIVRRRAFHDEARRVASEARNLLAVFNVALADRLFDTADSLGMIDRRRVEICRALIGHPKLVLLDEPSAGMTIDETDAVMDEILRYSEGIRRPQCGDCRARDGIDTTCHRSLRSAELRQEDCGRSLSGSVPRPGGPHSLPWPYMSVLLAVANIFTAYDKVDVLTDVSMDVNAGSITCILGSNGAGKTSLIRSILRLTPPRAGAINFDGKSLEGLKTHDVIRLGIGVIPEGRRIFAKMTVTENLRLGAYSVTSGTTHKEANGSGFHRLSSAAGACETTRRNNVRWRTSDDLDRSWSDGQAEAVHHRRTVARGFPRYLFRRTSKSFETSRKKE